MKSAFSQIRIELARIELASELFTAITTALLLLTLSLALCASSLQAQTVDTSGSATREREWREAIPESLQEWVPWVSRDIDMDSDDCLAPLTSPSTKRCVWLPKLDLALTSSGAQAALVIAVDKVQELVELPGSRGVWPYEVYSKAGPLPIVERNARPAVHLKKGIYLLRANYRWEKIPSSFALPRELALLSLRIEGEQVTFPQRSPDGAVWTQQQEKVVDEVVENDRLEVEVYRHLRDEIPQKLTTVLSLRVSGKPREIQFHKSAFLGNVFKIASPFPVQTEGDALTFQIRAGAWNIHVESFIPEIRNTFQPIDAGEYWPSSEVWAIESVPTLRSIEYSGGTPIGIDQTNVPREWKHFPLFLLEKDETLALTEIRRGGAKASRDHLQLQKQIWLSFDGEQFSVKDTVSGQIAESGRLEYTAGGALGRVSINGVDQYITKLPDAESIGVEVREGSLQLESESKLSTSDSTMNSGWNRDFDSVRGSITLPPGWRIFSASGVDWISNSWVQAWSLLDIFLVLVTTVATIRLFSPLLGILAGVMLLLVEPEQTFSATILFFLAAASLASVLPKGILQKLSRFAMCLAALGLVSQGVVFAVSHFRAAMYPQLSDFYLGGEGVSSTAYYDMSVNSARSGNVATEAYRDEAEEVEMFGREAPMQMLEKRKRSAEMLMDSLPSSAPAKAGSAAKIVAPQSQYVKDANLVSQTGFGVNDWQGRQIRFQWNGPLAASETFSFCLFSPALNLFLAILRILLLVAVVGAMLSKFRTLILNNTYTERSSALLLLLFASTLLVSGAPTSAEAQDSFPNDALLRQLKDYVTKSRSELPYCHPSCTGFPSVVIEDGSDAGGNELELSLSIHTVVDTTVPLIALSDRFVIDAVLINDTPVTRVSSIDSMIWVGVGAGTHSFRLRLTVQEVEELSLQFAMQPSQVQLTSKVWKSDTIRDGTVSGNVVTLRRAVQAPKIAAETEEAGTTETRAKAKQRLTPLFQVTRVLDFGVQWAVHTTVSRVSLADRTEQVQIPLLAGESLTSSGIEVNEGKAQIVIPSGQRSVSWDSSLEQTPTVKLSAPKAPSVWSETWRVNATNLWHVNFEGTPRIFSTQSSRQGIPEWQPRPGEELSISVEKPLGVEGPTVTIDDVSHEISVGSRIRDAVLQYTIKTSKGSVQEVQLPTEVELSELKINGNTRPLRAVDGKVSIQLAPGSQEVRIAWRENKELPVRYRSADVNLNVPAVNVKTKVTFPSDRWVLWLSGPLIGPVVLFWAIVPLWILASFLLSRWKHSPLRFYQWLLLFFGLSQASIFANAVVVAWFILFALRKEHGADTEHPWRFRFQQLFLAFLTYAAVQTLFAAVRRGLLAAPEMNIQGISSYGFSYFWFQDAIEGMLPRVSVLSFDMFWYRAVMLLWSLWLAFAAISWLRWAWTSYSSGGYWVPISVRAPWRKKKGDTSNDGAEIPSLRSSDSGRLD